MPIYEYECTKCGHQTEVWQKISEAPMARCAHCKGKMRKLISQSTFHLKGTGWYVTDYASKRSADNGKKEKSSEETDSKSKESKVKESKNTSDKPIKASSNSSKKD